MYDKYQNNVADALTDWVFETNQMKLPSAKFTPMVTVSPFAVFPEHPIPIMRAEHQTRLDELVNVRNSDAVW